MENNFGLLLLFKLPFDRILDFKTSIYNYLRRYLELSFPILTADVNFIIFYRLYYVFFLFQNGLANNWIEKWLIWLVFLAYWFRDLEQEWRILVYI